MLKSLIGVELIFSVLFPLTVLKGTNAFAKDFHPSGQAIQSNKEIVRASFEQWLHGKGTPLDLLSDRADWTFMGSSKLSRTYPSKKAFMDKVMVPFGKRFSKAFRPTNIYGVFSDGDTVIALFDGEGVAKDGKVYRNSHAWFLKMKDGQIVSVRAFLDTQAHDDLWSRVSAQ